MDSDFGGLDEHGVFYDEGEVDSGRMVAMIYEPFGDVQRLLSLRRLHHDLVLAKLVVGDTVRAPELRPDVVCVQDGHVSYVAEFRTVHPDVVPSL